MHVEQNFISASGAAARRFVDAVLNGVRRGKYVAAGATRVKMRDDGPAVAILQHEYVVANGMLCNNTIAKFFEVLGLKIPRNLPPVWVANFWGFSGPKWAFLGSLWCRSG